MLRIARVMPAERVVVRLGSTTQQFPVVAFLALTLLGDAPLLIPAIAYCLIMWLAARERAACAARISARADIG